MCDIDISSITPKELQGKSPENVLKVAKAAMKELNVELKEIPNRIDEQKLSKPEIETSLEDINAEIERLQAELQTTQKLIANLEANDSTKLVAYNAYMDAQTKYSERKIAYTKELEQRTAEQESPIKSAYEVVRQYQNEISLSEIKSDSYRKQIERSEREIQDASERREELLDKYTEVKEAEFVPDSVLCPTCGQALPTDKISEMVAKYNIAKSNKLAKIIEDGNAVKKSLEGWREQLANSVQEKADTDAIIEAYKVSLDEAERYYSELKDASEEIISAPFDETEEADALITAINDAYVVYENPSSVLSVVEVTSAYQSKINSLNAEIAELNKDVAKYDQITAADVRIAELEKEEKTISESYAEQDRLVFICEEFQRQRAKLIDKRVSQFFPSNIKFELFENNITNDGIKEKCDVLIKNKNGFIPYEGGASTSERIRADIAIADALSRYYKINIPLFIDNAEAITANNRLKSPNQQIVWFEVAATA
jgi:DNA repair exonuclease SbcCD ATPase subunit